uniref:C-C motif chemokine n=1 Tax=Terrapene triunguis TaxID=2587831 RepID=A0A674JZQ3_9SAUR
MKVSVAAIVFVLMHRTVHWFLPSLSGSSYIQPTCCFSYTSRQIPRRFVVDYFVTSNVCSQPGVVFITTKGRQVCTNPEDAWVQQYVKDLK